MLKELVLGASVLTLLGATACAGEQPAAFSVVEASIGDMRAALASGGA